MQIKKILARQYLWLGVNNCDGLWYVNHFMAVSDLEMEKQNTTTKPKHDKIFVSQIKQINVPIVILNAFYENTKMENSLRACEQGSSIAKGLIDSKDRKQATDRVKWLSIE